MLKNKPYKIGIIAPKEHKHLLALASITRTLTDTFPKSDISEIQMDQLLLLTALQKFDLIVLPASHGDVTPYEFFLKGQAAENIGHYAQNGSVAAFCSGAYALMDNFLYTYPDGITKSYRGYAPVLDISGKGPVDFEFRIRKDPSRFADIRLLEIFSTVSVQPKKLFVCYGNGPGFSVDPGRWQRDMRGLAFFDNGLASVLAHKTGNGMIVAFGVLPEIQPSHFPEKGPAWLQDIHARLQQTDFLRRQLWDKAMRILVERHLYPESLGQAGRIAFPS